MFFAWDIAGSVTGRAIFIEAPAALFAIRRTENKTVIVHVYVSGNRWIITMHAAHNVIIL